MIAAPPGGRPPVTVHYAIKLMHTLSPAVGMEGVVICEVLNLSRQQLERAVAQARRIIRPLGHDVVVERASKTSYRYRLTASWDRIQQDMLDC